MVASFGVLILFIRRLFLVGFVRLRFSVIKFSKYGLMLLLIFGYDLLVDIIIFIDVLKNFEFYVLICLRLSCSDLLSDLLRN